MWQKLIAEGSRKRRRAEFTDVDEDFDAVEAAEIWMRRELQTQKQRNLTETHRRWMCLAPQRGQPSEID